MANPEKPKYIYNVAGMAPYTQEVESWNKLCTDLQRIGFQELYLLPVRALEKPGGWLSLKEDLVAVVHPNWTPPETSSEFLGYLVGAWNQLIVRPRIKDQTQALPAITQDALFPGKSASQQILERLSTQFSKAKFATWSIECFPPSIPTARLIFETGPNMGKTPQEIIGKVSALQGARLEWDHTHPVLPPKTVSAHGQPTRAVSNWEKELQIFADSGLVTVVDIHESNPQIAQAAKEVPSVVLINIEVGFNQLFGLKRAVVARTGSHFGRDFYYQEAIQKLSKFLQTIKSA